MSSAGNQGPLRSPARNKMVVPARQKKGNANHSIQMAIQSPSEMALGRLLNSWINWLCKRRRKRSDTTKNSEGANLIKPKGNKTKNTEIAAKKMLVWPFGNGLPPFRNKIHRANKSPAPSHASAYKGLLTSKRSPIWDGKYSKR